MRVGIELAIVLKNMLIHLIVRFWGIRGIPFFADSFVFVCFHEGCSSLDPTDVATMVPSCGLGTAFSTSQVAQLRVSINVHTVIYSYFTTS